MLRERGQGKLYQFCMTLVWVLPCSFYQRHAYRSRDSSLLIMLIGCGWKLKINEVRATPCSCLIEGSFLCLRPSALETRTCDVCCWRCQKHSSFPFFDFPSAEPISGSQSLADGPYVFPSQIANPIHGMGKVACFPNLSGA